MHSIENYNENYYVQCSQQLGTADKKFKIEAESYLSLCEEKQSMYSQNSLLFWRDYGNNFPTLQVFAVFRNVGRFGGSGEPLNSLLLD